MKILETNSLSVGYQYNKKKIIVQSNLNLQIEKGEMVCLIGPNGSGKSTLLRTLAGLQAPLFGVSNIEGTDIQDISIKERANLISLVLTDRVEIENATVQSLVAMGAHLHTNWWGKLDNAIQTKVDRAIAMVNLQEKKSNLLSELSDGEKQRAMIAKAFLQDTPIIILDEPTAHLDLPNRVEIMLLLHRLAHETGKTVLMSTHELDIALQAADKVWLMTEGKGVEVGVPEDLVLSGKFNEVFQSDNYIFNPTNGNFSMNYQLEKQVSVEGEPTKLYWTLRALARAGYAVVDNAKPAIIIKDNCWYIGENQYDSIESLLNALANAMH